MQDNKYKNIGKNSNKKLSQKSIEFLTKFQSGGMQPLSPLPQTQPVLKSMTSNPLDISPYINNYTSNVDEPSSLEQFGQAASTIPLLGMVAQAGLGGYQIGKSIVEKKKAKKKEQYYKQDLAERQRDVRLNSYLNTPYGSYQQGGVMDAYSANYNQMQEFNRESQAKWEEYYNELNKQNEQLWRGLRQQGISNAGSAVGSYLGLATKALTSGAMQEGGEYSEQTDIYSEKFDSNVFLEKSSMDKEMEITKQNETQELMNWVMQDEEEYSPIQKEYENSNLSSSGSIIEDIGQSESGGNYQVVNPTTGTTGKYQFHPKYWSEQIKEFSGLPDDYSRDEVMDYFKSNPNIQEQFMNHVVENIYKPEIQKLKPYIDKYGFNEEQMIRMLHYRGLADTKKRLISGNFEVSQSEKDKYNNPEILDYINR